MARITNELLLEKINNLHSKVDAIKRDLQGVKDEVEENTTFRNKAKGVIGAVSIIATSIGAFAMWVASKISK